MVSKKSFTLLVASGTTPYFAFVSIISVKDCSFYPSFASIKNSFSAVSGKTTFEMMLWTDCDFSKFVS